MRLHFIGIGGIGLSGLARYFCRQGYQVTGSDIKETPLIEELRSEGIKVVVPHKSANIDRFKPDLVVFSAVIKPNNPELRRARELGIETLSRRQFLKFLVSDKKVISVCGAHGKSTTSAILATLLPESSAVIGAISKEFHSNCRVKPGELLVFEADESDGSFVDSNPYVSVVTNTEPEHMEFYNYDLNRFYSHYWEFLKKAKYRVANGGDPFFQTNFARLPPELADFFSFLPTLPAHLPNTRLINLKLADEVEEGLNGRGEPVTRFTYRGERFQIYGFGDHLITDALLAIEAANLFAPLSQLADRMKSYRGIKKRFDIVFDNGELVIVDDYGHHPTEIEQTLQGAFRFAQLRGLKGVTAIWQPHKYSRTIDNLEGFKRCFEGVDRLIILPVWSAGEEPRPINFEKEFKKYKPIFVPRVYRYSSYLRVGDFILNRGLVIGFGAGDITYQLRHSYPTHTKCGIAE
jgi:UDP-N-acetylmuramate--alanine ligase